MTLNVIKANIWPFMGQMTDSRIQMCPKRVKCVLIHQTKPMYYYVVLPPRQIKSTVWLCGRIKNRRRQKQKFDQNNNQSTTLLTFTIWNVTLLKNEPFMRYQRFKKGGRVAKSQFLEKVCKNSLIRK